MIRVIGERLTLEDLDFWTLHEPTGQSAPGVSHSKTLKRLGEERTKASEGRECERESISLFLVLVVE